MNHPTRTDFAGIAIPSTENTLSRRYLALLNRWVPIGMSLYAPWSERPECGHFLGGVYYYGMETGMIAFSLAAAVSSPEFDERVAGISRGKLRKVIRSAIRYLCFTHDTGPAECLRPSTSIGKKDCEASKWGERGKGFFRESQCGANLGPLFAAAALVADELEEEERSMLAAIAADYLDRFASMEPRSGVFFDTQMEENVWTSEGIIASALMLEHDDRYASWIESAERWLVSATAKPADRHDTRAFGNGRTVREMVKGACTLLPDNTAENHGFVHPTYMSSSIALSTSAVLLLRLWGKPPLSNGEWHFQEIYDQLARWSDTNGVPLAVQGMDWPYVPITPWSFVHAGANVRLGDRRAAFLEQKTLTAVEAMLAAQGGRVISEEVAKYCRGPQDPAAHRERQIVDLAWSYFLHRLLGEGVTACDEAELLEQTQGVHIYPHGGTTVHVHKHGKSSYSWRNGMMALVEPPEGIALIGHARGSLLAKVAFAGFTCGGEEVEQQVRESADRVIVGAVETISGVANDANLSVGFSSQPLARRELLYASLPNGWTIIHERLSALAEVTIESVRQGGLSVINDPVFPPRPGTVAAATATTKPRRTVSVRTVYHAGGVDRFEGFAAADSSANRTVRFARAGAGRPAWINIDDRLGIVFSGNGTGRYLNQHTFAVWRAVEDDLLLNDLETPIAVRPGETFAELVTLLCPEQHHDETARLSIPVAEHDGVLELRAGEWVCRWNRTAAPVTIPTPAGPRKLEPGEPSIEPC